MANEFQFDVFLSHSAKNKAVVRTLAERLRQHTPEFQPSAFCIQSFHDAPTKGSRAQFLYINWRLMDREQEYANLTARLDLASHTANFAVSKKHENRLE